MSLSARIQQRIAVRREKVIGQTSRYYAATVRIVRRPSFLFVIGHMRSGSTLLTHILNSNPHVVGLGENHLSYWREKDLDRCVANTMKMHSRRDLRERYVLDKILHNQHSVSPCFLNDPRFRFVYLVREPRNTLSSLLRLSRVVPGFYWSTYDLAAKHYIRRLHHLAKTVEQQRSRERAIVLTYEQLIQSSREMFVDLESFLGLEVPLREKYELMPTTGKPPYGDPGEAIKSGSIQRKNEKHSVVPFIPADLLDECEHTYLETLKLLSHHCARAVRAGAQGTSLREAA
jgi:hypothetical protein